MTLTELNAWVWQSGGDGNTELIFRGRGLPPVDLSPTNNGELIVPFDAHARTQFRIELDERPEGR